MNIIYKWTDSSKKFLFKINGNIYTTFKVTNTGNEGQEYLAWLAEGNEPLPADEPTAY